jgi:hypothetical protein
LALISSNSSGHITDKKVGLIVVRTIGIVHFSTGGEVYGLGLRRSGRGRYRVVGKTEVYASGGGRLQFGRVCDGLDIGGGGKVVLCGEFKAGGCFDLVLPEMPPSEMSGALSFELPKHVPVALERIIWGYRWVKSENGQAHLRVFFVLREEWEKLLAEVRASGCKFDTFIYPGMAGDTELSGNDVSEFAKEFTGLEAGDTEKYLPGLLVGKYVLEKNYDRFEKPTGVRLPRDITPRRNNLFKAVTFCSGMAALICLLLMVNQAFQADYSIYRKQDEALDNARNILLKLNEINRKHRLKIKEIDKIIEDVPEDVDNLRALDFLAARLPRTMWITNYNLNSDKINLSLQSASDPGNVMGRLNNSKNYKIANLRKNRSHDGSYRIYLVLSQAGE